MNCQSRFTFLYFFFWALESFASLFWLAVAVSTSKLFLLLYVSHFLADVYFCIRALIFIFIFMSICLFFFCWDVEVNLTFGWKLKIDKVKERSKFRPSAYSEFSIDNKNKEQAGMLPFGGSFFLTLDSLFSVVLLSYHPTSWVFFFPLSIGKFLTKNPLRSTQRFFLPKLQK